MKSTRESGFRFIPVFVTALVLLGVVAWGDWRYLLRTQADAERVVHSQDSRLQRAAVLLQTLEIESRARGFAATGEPDYLADFDARLSSTLDDVRAMRQSARDAEQASNLSALEPLIAERLRIATAIVQLRRTAGFEAARQQMLGGEGRAAMDAIRALAARIDAREQAVHEQANTAAVRNRDMVVRLSVGAIVLAGVLFTVVFVAVRRENLRRIETEARLDRFFSLSPDLFCVAGMDGYFKQLNPAFSRTLGYTSEELLARPFLDFTHPDDRAATRAEAEKLGRGAPTIQFRNRFRCHDGSSRWLSWNAQPVIEESLMYATARDITGLKHNEDRMAAVVDELSAFKAALDEHAIVAITDRRGKITYVNDKFCTISKFAREELLGQDHRIVNSGHHSKPFIRELWETIKGGRVWSGEIKNRAKDGTFYWVATTIVPFLDEHGQPSQYIAIRADITERKRAEERVVQLNAELQAGSAQLVEANGELESFSYSVSHDLRAPLRHVQGYVELLDRASAGQLSAKAQRYVEIIKAASVDMGQLIDDLLEFSRMGRAEMRESRVELAALVHETIRKLEMATAGRNIVWQVAPLPVVLGDPAMLQQVMANLVGNAVKYSARRDPARIEIACAGDEDGRAVLFVRDNGAGFDMQYVDKLFGVFQRLHRADEFEGTGIGLATVRRIVARHGGRAWAEGAPDQGATFYVTLKRLASE